jgi:hypothetical protein
MFCLWEASEDKLHHLIMEKHYVPNQIKLVSFGVKKQQQ